MSEKPFNPDEPLFLASRALDEELAESERTRLEALKGSDPQMMNASEELASVDRLVRSLRGAIPEVDDAGMVERVLKGCAGVDSDEKLDALLRRWAHAPEEVESERFVETVMTKARRRTGQARRMVWTVRLGVPLAAAAAVLFAVWFGGGPAPEVTNDGTVVSVVSFRPASVSASSTQSRVAFVRGTGGERPEPSGGQVGVGWIGTGVANDGEEEPPL